MTIFSPFFEILFSQTFLWLYCFRGAYWTYYLNVSTHNGNKRNIECRWCHRATLESYIFYTVFWEINYSKDYCVKNSWDFKFSLGINNIVLQLGRRKFKGYLKSLSRLKHERISIAFRILVVRQQMVTAREKAVFSIFPKLIQI